MLMNFEKSKPDETPVSAAATPHDVATTLGVSLPTLYRWIPASERE